MKQSKHVYIVNNSGHDFSSATKYGDVIYLSDGKIGKFDMNDMYRTILPILQESSMDDYILPTSLPILSALAMSLFAHMHGRINVLLYDAATNKYAARTIVFNARREEGFIG